MALSGVGATCINPPFESLFSKLCQNKKEELNLAHYEREIIKKYEYVIKKGIIVDVQVCAILLIHLLSSSRNVVKKYHCN